MADFTRCKSWLCAWVISSYWLIKSTLYPQALSVNVPPCLWLHKVIPYCLAQLYVGELHLNSPIKEPLLYSNIKRNHLWVLNLYLNIILTMCWVEKGSSLKHKKGILSMWVLKALPFSRFFLGEGGLFWQGGVQSLAGQTMQETVYLFIYLILQRHDVSHIYVSELWHMKELKWKNYYASPLPEYHLLQGIYYGQTVWKKLCPPGLLHLPTLWPAGLYVHTTFTTSATLSDFSLAPT